MKIIVYCNAKGRQLPKELPISFARFLASDIISFYQSEEGKAYYRADTEEGVFRFCGLGRGQLQSEKLAYYARPRRPVRLVQHTGQQKSSEPPVDFRELSAGFPELVNAKGEGWLYRHVRAVVKFVQKDPELVDVRAQNSCAALSRGFTSQWKKVRQFQVPIFVSDTKGTWTLRFDDVLADALEAGPLRREEYVLPAETAEAIRSADLNGVSAEVAEEVVRFYLANQREDTDWVVLPVTNFDCWFGNTNFSRK